MKNREKKIRQSFRLSWIPFCAALLSCKSSSGIEHSELKESLRQNIVGDDALPPFDFCPQKKKVNANNLVWMTYFSGLEYSHFSVAAKSLSRLGFGRAEDKKFYEQKFLELRISRVENNVLSLDDTWKSENERQEILKKLKKNYQDSFKKSPDKQNYVDIEKAIVDTEREGGIYFISGYKEQIPGKIDKTSTQAFYAEHAEKNFAVVSFRGTEVDEDLDKAADLDIKHIKLPYFPDQSNVMRGFLNAYNEVDGKLIALLEKKSKSKKINLWVTGHSLGGAIANIFVSRVMQAKLEGKLENINLIGAYTFGAPRVGDNRFALRTDLLSIKLNIPIYRVRNYIDIVPGVPFGMFANPGYWHAGSLVYYDENGETFFGDGWQDIEQKSDLKRSTPSLSPMGKDMHNIALYFANAKKFLVTNPDSKNRSCTPEKDEKGYLPFVENPALREIDWKDAADKI